MSDLENTFDKFNAVYNGIEIAKSKSDILMAEFLKSDAEDGKHIFKEEEVVALLKSVSDLSVAYEELKQEDEEE